MIPAGVEVFVATQPVDLRCGFDRLAGIAAERLGQNPRGGALFVFFGKRRTSVKVLFADRTGLCIFYKRLDSGTFRIPEGLTPDATSITLTERAGFKCEGPGSGARAVAPLPSTLALPGCKLGKWPALRTSRMSTSTPRVCRTSAARP